MFGREKKAARETKSYVTKERMSLCEEKRHYNERERNDDGTHSRGKKRENDGKILIW